MLKILDLLLDVFDVGDFKFFLLVAKKNLKNLLTLSIIFSLLVLLISLNQDKKYLSKATIVIEPEENKIVNIDCAEFEVICGKGTYVRSLARDLAEKLNTLGHVIKLRRNFVGNFDEKDTIFIDFSEEIIHSPSFLKKIKPIEKVLDDIPALFLTETEAIKIRQGQKSTLDSFKFHKNLIKEHPHYKKFERIYAISNDKIIALIEIDEGIVKPKRIINY